MDAHFEPTPGGKPEERHDGFAAALGALRFLVVDEADRLADPARFQELRWVFD